MDKNDQQKYRKLYRDVLRGYSEFKYSDKTVYVKHFRETDLGDIEDFDEQSLKEAIDKGVPTEKEQLELLIRDGLWDERKEQEIKAFQEDLVNMRQTLSKLVLKHQVNSQNKRIERLEEKLNGLLYEKKNLVGYTAETYVEKKVNAEYLRHSLYKDSNIKDKFWSEQEFYEVSDVELAEVTVLNNQVMTVLNSTEIKNLAACAFFINALSISKKNPQIFFGLPVSKLSNYQIDLFSNGIRYLSVLEEGKTPSEESVQSPVRLRQWYESMLEARTNKSVKVKQNEKENQGGTIFGADKEELQNFMGSDENGPAVDLQKEIQKRGGKALTLGDMIEIHGHGKKGENILIN